MPLNLWASLLVLLLPHPQARPASSPKGPSFCSRQHMWCSSWWSRAVYMQVIFPRTRMVLWPTKGLPHCPWNILLGSTVLHFSLSFWSFVHISGSKARSVKWVKCVFPLSRQSAKRIWIEKRNALNNAELKQLSEGEASWGKPFSHHSLPKGKNTGAQ